MNKNKQISEWKIYWRGGGIELIQGDKFYKSFLKKHPLSSVRKLAGHIWMGYVK